MFLLGVTQAAVDVRDRFPLNPTVQVGAACGAALAPLALVPRVVAGAASCYLACMADAVDNLVLEQLRFMRSELASVKAQRQRAKTPETLRG